MTLVLLAVGLALLALPGLLRSAGARLAPAEWCRSVAACLRVGRVAIHAGLGLAAAPVALDAAGVHHLAHACHRTAMDGVPAPAVAGWVAVVLVAASTHVSLAARRRDRAALARLRAEPWLGSHRHDDGIDVVTLPCADRLAYAVPGRPHQIVVSAGLLEALDDEERRAVLRHERAHLRHRHHSLLRLAGDLDARFGWLPPARGSIGVLRLAVERWADEEAGSGSRDARPAVRRALLKTTALALTPAPAFTDVCTIAARLHALSAPPPRPTMRRRALTAGPMVGLCAATAVALTACSVAAHDRLDGLLGHCPF